MSAKKSDALKAQFGANIAQTVAMRGPAAATPSSAAAAVDRYAGATKARSFGELPVDAILTDPQPRTEFNPDDLARLAESIKRFGQLAPIRVRFDEPRGRWVVLVGERRLRACRLAGLERVRAEFVEREMSEADMLAEQIVENAVRADLQPVEQGRAYQRLLELNGWTAQTLAENIGVEASAVYRALALLRLPSDVATRIDAGDIRATAGYELTKLQFADEQRTVAQMIVAEGLDHKATVEEVNRRRHAGRRRKGAGRSRPRTFRTDAGKVTVEPRKGAGADAVVSALEQALAQARAEAEGKEAA